LKERVNSNNKEGEGKQDNKVENEVEKEVEVEKHANALPDIAGTKRNIIDISFRNFIYLFSL
jgi:hypothetical protein